MLGEENDIVQEDENNEVTEQEVDATEEVNDELTAEAEESQEETAEVDIETLQALLEKEKEQSQANRDSALRAQAEMENLRKRTTRDIENAHKYALEKFVNELLPIIDSLSLGMTAAETAENVDELREGMDLTLKMFSSAIDKFGVKEINPQGDKFNPEQHEAISMQEIEGTESNTVVAVMQKGYELNGRLVRPAMVVVSK
ncbi:MAG TPA: nucleotide exchange factor GrpE [Thiotrichaceae bacterium]|jgi:molecular chaperone GrpE|nr:nucleotide exchange factor GrpE [Thiotrichaceae bacterium]HIM08414.1 nucleotide exchange factor GrpE [Gammaproteobacteria bacterium]